VVAVSDGRKLTVEEIQKIIDGLPVQLRQNFYRDPKQFLNQWFLLQKLSALAEKAGLANESPYKEGLAVQRMQLMAQAQIEESTKHLNLTVDDQKKYYEARKDNYSQAQLKIIYVSFATDPKATGLGGKKLPSETEAKAKAEDLVKQLRGGADFIKMVKEHSEDTVSVGKDGDFGPVGRNDQLPEPVKAAIFALKKGEISDPVKQPNGFYIFRMEGMIAKPFEEVQGAITAELRNVKLKEWLESTQKAVEVKVENPGYFANPPGK
jgi:peptidyl-prolyl cis-trans isomerase C